MKALREKILKDGKLIGNEIVKVDGFLNHQIDVKFMEEIGAAFSELFATSRANKILTVEASGIAAAYATSTKMGYLPVVFAKKATPSTMIDGFYSAKAKSFTKGTESNFVVSKAFLNSQDKILIIDDFLASGEASNALVDIVLEAGATVVGFGAVIEKKYQGGRILLEKRGIKTVSLATISKIENGQIVFE